MGKCDLLAVELELKNQTDSRLDKQSMAESSRINMLQQKVCCHYPYHSVDTPPPFPHDFLWHPPYLCCQNLRLKVGGSSFDCGNRC